ncbi:MAG: cysteine synthase A [Oscillospiraceae bacterium]
MNIAHSLSDTIGNTPLLHLRKFAPDALIYGKLESMNPLSSAKDRAAYFMILDAEERGVLTADTVIIEPTSGNMGVGLATVAAQKGYHLILTMPETMSVERRSLLAALGAELVLTPGSEGMGGAIKKANELLETLPKAWMPNQFNNPANARAHYETTGPEIWRDTDGTLDVFVAGIGSGGTITGAGRYLKERKPDVRVVAVEPADSPVLSGGKPGPHRLQGIGAGFVPGTLDTGIYDEIVTITTEEAFAACRRLAKTEGLLVGISSGAAAAAAVKLAIQYPGQRIVAVLPDTGERYLSTDLFAKDV